MTRPRISRPWYRWPIALYDRMYRLVNGLDRAEARVGPALRVGLRRSWRRAILADGTVIARGDLVGVIHLDNERLAAIHADGLAPAAAGLEFRRRFMASLHELAGLAGPGGPLARARAFTAITIFVGLRRLGFAAEPGARGSALVGAYQRLLLAALHPAGRHRRGAPPGGRAERLWISRDGLLARFGPPAAGLTGRDAPRGRSARSAPAAPASAAP
jgi:hypothetical protein